MSRADLHSERKPHTRTAQGARRGGGVIDPAWAVVADC